jgi:hypothetical protein
VAYKDPDSALPHPDEVRESASWITSLLSDLVATVDYEYSLDGMLDKLIGDWHILDEAGKAYLHTGEALRVCDEEGSDGLKRLMRHWDGGAAEASMTTSAGIFTPFEIRVRRTACWVRSTRRPPKRCTRLPNSRSRRSTRRSRT